ncbi:hypothetical protein NMG60_11024312 [Bertholletia excelsa]
MEVEMSPATVAASKGRSGISGRGRSRQWRRVVTTRHYLCLHRWRRRSERRRSPGRTSAGGRRGSPPWTREGRWRRGSSRRGRPPRSTRMWRCCRQLRLKRRRLLLKGNPGVVELWCFSESLREAAFAIEGSRGEVKKAK